MRERVVALDMTSVRAAFPALVRHPHRLYLDAPGGTQACAAAIRAMAAHLEEGTANSGGAFVTSIETDAISAAAHEAMADLLGGRPDEIAFGPNMTSLTLALSRALARDWQPGDELVVTRLDHDANVTPWTLVAADRGMTVRWLDFDPADGTLRLDELPGLIGPRTRLVALGGASNALGTLNDVAAAARVLRVHSDALLFVDAVQSVPHVATDVAALGCDFLACSPYKFFGPHAGVLWSRREAMAAVRPYKLRPSASEPPAARLEAGTPAFEAQAGILATVDHLASLGGKDGMRRERVLRAFAMIEQHEAALSARFLTGLARIEGAHLHGPPTASGRVPTFGFTLGGRHPREAAAALAAQDIFVWSGDFYAVEPIARLGLADGGGLIRIGFCHYHDEADVDRVLAALEAIA